jgi:acyl carrier protein phosphodiesterase
VNCEKTIQRQNGSSVKVRPMNFLAHLLLAGDDDGLRLGAMLGDFVRGNIENSPLPKAVRRGIRLHRYIDQHIDALPDVQLLREQFEPPFRRYSGIIIDLAFDHELAKSWSNYSAQTLEQFDLGVRSMLKKHDAVVPAQLRGFMSYADQRGLFATYREEDEILYSLKGLGRRLSRPNPLDRVREIWADVKPAISQGFIVVFPKMQESVSAWLQEPENQAVP